MSLAASSATAASGEAGGGRPAVHRQPEWLWQALWAGARRGVLHMRLPDVVLVDEAGAPTRWIGSTADGKLCRRELSTRSSRLRPRPEARAAHAGHQAEFYAQEKLAAAREAFAAFRAARLAAGDVAETAEKAPLCVAWYRDGGREELSDETFEMLLKHKEWRVQLCALQAYLRPSRTGSGVFDANRPGMGGGAGAASDPRFRAGDDLGLLCKALAAFAERAYGVPGAVGGAGGDATVARLKVERIEATFAFDDKGGMWLSHADDIMVRMQHSKREAEEEVIRQKERKSYDAARAVAAELRRLLRIALHRGVGIDSSFSHFDTTGLGFVDANGLLDGISRLGIAATAEVASILMGMIGSASRHHFRAIDLREFAEAEDDEDNEGVDGAAALAAATGFAGLDDDGAASVGGGSSVASGYNYGGGRSTAGADSDGRWTPAFARGTPAAAAADGLGMAELPKEAWRERAAIILSQSRRAESQDSAAATNGPPLLSQGDDALSRSLGGGGGSRTGANSLLRTASASSLGPSRVRELARSEAGGGTSAWGDGPPGAGQPQHKNLRPRGKGGKKRQRRAPKVEEALPSWARPMTKRALDELERRRRAWQYKLALAPGAEADAGDDSASSLLGTGDIESALAAAEADDALLAELTGGGASAPSTAAAGDLGEGLLSAEAFEAATADEDGGGYSEAKGGDDDEAPRPASGYGVRVRPPDPSDTQFFHAERGVVCTYKIVHGAAAALALAGGGDGAAKTKDARTVLQRFADVRKSGAKMDKAAEGTTPYLIVALPDLFSTLASLEASFAPLLDKHPNGSVLLVGWPGLPDTHWPSGTKLSNEFHASVVSRLLQHLDDTSQFNPDAKSPTFLYGGGAGANVAALFAATHLLEPRHESLRASLRSLVLTNGFVGVDASLKKVCGALLRVLMRGEYHERVQLLAALHFSDAHLEKVGRPRALRDFWSTRRGLGLGADAPSGKDAKAAPGTRGRSRSPTRTGGGSAGGGGSDARAGSPSRRSRSRGGTPHKAGVANGSSDGVRALLRGVGAYVPLDTVLPALAVPLVLLQSAGDRFVAPSNAERWAKAHPGMAAVQSPRDCARASTGTPMVSVSWLKAGHDLMLERQAYTTNVFSRLITASAEVLEYMRLGAEAGGGGPPGSANGAQVSTGVLDGLRSEGLAFSDSSSDDGSASSGDEADTGGGGSFADGSNAAAPLSDGEGEGNGAGDDGDARPGTADTADSVDEDARTMGDSTLAEQATIASGATGGGGGDDDDDDAIDTTDMTAEERLEAEESNRKKRERRMREQALRRERQQMVRKRRAEELRQKEMKAMRMEKLKALEREREAIDREVMRREDSRSALAAEYHAACVKWEAEAGQARQRATELQAAREEDESRELEYAAASRRSAKHEARRAHMEAERKRIENEELTMDGERPGGYDISTHDVDIKAASAASQRLIADLFQSRRKLLQTLKKTGIVEDKVALFQSQYDETDGECRRLRRTLRMVETNSMIQSLGPSDREVDELKADADKKEVELSELQSLLSGRKTMLSASNRLCQGLKIKVAKKEASGRAMLKQLAEVERNLNARLGALRLTKDRLDADIKDRRKVLEDTKSRKVNVAAELERLLAHEEKFPQAKYVNTDLWQPGVMQRMIRSELKLHLTHEDRTLGSVADEMEKTLYQKQDDLMSSTSEMQRKSGEASTASNVKHNVQEAFHKAAGKTVQQELEEMELREAEAERLAAEHAGSDALRAAAAASGMDSLQGRIRLKASTDRTVDEKHWVALDLLINPKRYDHVSEAEAEDIKFDPAYVTQATAQDVGRLLKLPQQLNLALPFLFTAEEIEMHRLLCQFTHEQGAEHFRKLDAASQAKGDATERDEGDDALAAKGVTGAALRQAETWVEVAVRERVAARLRALPQAERTKEENDFVACDRVLNPYLYRLDAETAALVDAEQHDEDLAAKTGNLGERYERQRVGYQSGAADDELGLADAWAPSMDRAELILIHAHDHVGQLSEEAQHVRFLLDKYHVSDEQSSIGKRRDEALRTLQAKMDRLEKQAEAQEELQANGGSGGGGGLLGRVKTLQASGALEGAAGPAEGGAGAPGVAAAAGGGGGGGDKPPDPELGARVWGSWEHTHPAAFGPHAQSAMFNAAGFNPLCDHAASYAPSKQSGSAQAEHEQAAAEAILGKPGHTGAGGAEYTVVRSLEGILKVKSGTKNILFATGKQHTVMDEDSLVLDARQSRSHKFHVPKVGDGIDGHGLDLTITIVFQGTFGARGYRLGRCAATLFRLPDETGGNALKPPTPIGHCPPELQALNSADSFGRMVIVHSPRNIPVRPGGFQVVIGAASDVKYSVTVTARLAEPAGNVAMRKFEEAKHVQNELPVVKASLEELWTSMRLAERKLHVVQALMDEAEAESSKCESEIEQCNDELAEDDERMEYTEDERNDIFGEIRTLEVEFAHWCRLFATRAQEKKDIKTGLDHMSEERRKQLSDRDKLDESLRNLRKLVPAAITVVVSIGAATEAALELNTTLQLSSAAGRWAALAAVKEVLSSTMTPAEEVRRRLQNEGWETLTLDEQQWTMLDRQLTPDRYEEFHARQEEEDAQRKKEGRRPKKRYNRAVSQFNYDKQEIERIMETPFRQLTRREVAVHKLLSRYHDNPQLLKQRAEKVASGFDAHLASRVRAKHKETLNLEEQRWQSIDKVINPELWKFIDKNAGGFDTWAKDNQESTMNYSKVTSAERDHQAAKDKANSSGKILSVASLVQGALDKKAAYETSTDLSKSWACTFSREEVLELWAMPPSKLTSLEKKKVHKLLLKYNGPFDEYMETMAEIDARKKLLEALDGREPAVRADQPGKTVTVDIDARCRVIQKEMDRAMHNSNMYMDSGVLHAASQRFPTQVLRLELERELDRLLREQVYEREKARKFLLEEDADESGSSDDDDDDLGDGGPEQKDDAEGGAGAGGENGGAGGGAGGGKKKKKQPAKQKDAKLEVLDVRKKVGAMLKMDAADKANAKDMEALGPGGCLACRKSKCCWCATCDVSTVKKRRQVLADEIHFVRMHPEKKVIESFVPLSAMRGGVVKYRYDDLIHELMWEDGQLSRRLRLNGVDKELHDAYATRKEYIEVVVLHGYRTLLWTSNARRALEREHSRLCAQTVAQETVDDILEWMLEGWYFGERESPFTVAGYVPSVKKDGFITAGSEQLRANKLAQQAMQDRAAKRLQDGEGVEDTQGTPREKALPIEQQAQWRLSKEKVVKEGTTHKEHLDTTEQTLRFGIFCMTFMYFRAMGMVRRERESWSGRTDAVGEDAGEAGAKVSAERRTMIEEERRALERTKKLERSMDKARLGEERRRRREEQERAEAAAKLHEKVRRERRERESSHILQRVYRGHLGRKAARRWAMKRAELEAMNALMNASAISMQRVWRGHLGRLKASEMRMEMAEFVAMIRMEEAAADEEEYWRTHFVARLKRDVKDFGKSVVASALGIKKEEDDEF